MTPLFKPGQEVICMMDNWMIIYPVRTLPDFEMPKKNEIYIVRNYLEVAVNGKLFITLFEFSDDHLFCQDWFAPVMPQDQLEDDLREIFHQPITK